MSFVRIVKYGAVFAAGQLFAFFLVVGEKQVQISMASAPVCIQQVIEAPIAPVERMNTNKPDIGNIVQAMRALQGKSVDELSVYIERVHK